MFQAIAGIRWQKQGDGSYLVHYNQDIFEANEVAIRILELLQQSKTQEEIIDILSKEYDAPKEILGKDIAATLTQFKNLGILKKVNDGGQ